MTRGEAIAGLLLWQRSLLDIAERLHVPSDDSLVGKSTDELNSAPLMMLARSASARWAANQDGSAQEVYSNLALVFACLVKTLSVTPRDKNWENVIRNLKQVDGAPGEVKEQGLDLVFPMPSARKLFGDYLIRAMEAGGLIMNEWTLEEEKERRSALSVALFWVMHVLGAVSLEHGRSIAPAELQKIGEYKGLESVARCVTVGVAI